MATSVGAPLGDARPREERKLMVFKMDPELNKVWAQYVEQNEEKFFRKFVKGVVSQWEKQICPNWDLLVAGRLQGHREEGPSLADLPEELLPAVSKFLFVTKDECEQGDINAKTVSEARELVKCLTVICRLSDNIPLVSSMDIVSLTTQIDSLLLRHLLEMESSFFSRKAEQALVKLRSGIMDFIVESCHLLESIYDPYLRWRAYLSGKDYHGSASTPDSELPPTPVALHQEIIPFLYESFETALADSFPSLAQELLTIFGAVISGARHNALKAISPATSKMLLKTIRDNETKEDVHITAIYCSAKSIQILHEMPMDERQLDIKMLIEQYQQILTSLAAKETVSLATMIEGVAMLSRILRTNQRPQELQKLLAQNGMIDALLDVSKDCKLNSDQKKTLLPVVINRISLLLKDCEAACNKMSRIKGYKRLFEVVNELGPPDSNTLHSILAMSTHGDDPVVGDKIIKTIEPVSYLLRWVAETEYDNEEQQSWLCESLYALCSANVQNKMLCCQSGILLLLVDCLKAFKKLHARSAVELLRLVEALGMHSITPFELKQLIMLMQKREDEDEKFPFKSHIIHVISSMAKSDGYEACRRYFDISGPNVKGLTVPSIRQWSGPVSGMSFHCWLRLDQYVADRKGTEERRQLYCLYTNTGNGFEAFVTKEGVLVAAVANKKEFLAVPLYDFPLNDEHWHCVNICHTAGKRPFGSSCLTIFIDGTKRLECSLKYPTLNEPISYCQIGSPLQRSNIPALNPEPKQTFKDGIMDAIKIGIPGVINIPKALNPGQNDPHVKWTLIGLEDQLWGRPISLCGQIGMICLFQDGLSTSQAKSLYTLGPNHGIAFPNEESPEIIDLLNRLVFFFSAQASHNMICPNLQSPDIYEAQVLAESFSTQDVKDVINCIGGVQALFPLLETAASSDESENLDTSYLSLRDESDNPGSRRQSAVEVDAEWEMLPSSSFSDWKLEQNAISGFLTLVKNLVTNHTINTEQLMRGGGVAVIGSLLQKAKPKLIDVNVLMASQLLVELSQATKDQKLLYQIYHSILFDFRIWARSEFHVQIGHIQYLSTIIKDDKRFFRKKFGVQFLLDVIRKYYSVKNEALSKEDCKTIRASLFGLVKFFLQRDVTAKDVHPIVAFLLAEKSEVLVRELSEMIAHYLDNKQAKDQTYLVMYESRRADLIYCLLLSKDFTPSLKRSLLRLLTVLLRTNKVSLRHKYRMHLAESRYLGFMHLWFKQAAKDGFPVTKEEILLVLDQMLLFDHPVSYQGILGLVHHLQWSDTETKLEVARRIMTCLFAKPEVPLNFARQIGWQECMTRLLVKKILKPDLDVSISCDDTAVADEATGALLSPTHYIEKATSTAKHYLPTPAGDAVELIGSTVGAVVQGTQKRVSSNVNFASEKVSNTVDAVYHAQERVTSRTQQILGKVQSGIDEAFSKKRRSSVSSMNEDGSMSQSTHSEKDRAVTPQYLQAYDQFGFEDLTLEVSKSTSTSSEDVSISRADTACSTPTRTHESISEDIPDIEVVDEDLSREVSNQVLTKPTNDSEEELCQLVINILFTIMWRGMHGASDEVMRERGQVIACINMLGLNNELFRSHIELKRRLVEQCLQAVLSDFREISQVNSESSNQAEHVMQWVYDLIVLDPYGKFSKKVSESLLDGVLGLVERLVLFQEGNAEAQWEEMAKMAFEVLLKCAENAEDVEICSMATAKLHGLVMTRLNSSTSENGYLIMRVFKMIQSGVDSKKESDQFSFLAPVMKALLEKSKEHLHVTTQLPSLNLKSSSQQFFEDFKKYYEGDEWKYFMEKKITPLYKGYLAGFLSELPREMDVFWAECYEMSQVAAHKRSREVGESKLKFQNKYLDPYHNAVKNENVRFNNYLSQQKSHLCFIRKRWQISKRLFFGPRGAWSSGEEQADYWRLASNENYLRMRMKLIPNPNFDPHLDASASRDNVKLEDSKGKGGLLQLQISKEALQSFENHAEDSLTEDELKSIAKEQMETANESTDAERLTERLVMTEDCELVTFMSVIKGKFELTTNFVYFFDSSPFKENEERHDFRWSLHNLREVHLRRFNLRRSGLEFFLNDQTNYFLNFSTKRQRNRVYSKVVGMKLPNLVYSSSRSPADLLRTSGLTQKWCSRDISNFEYLMQLNTIAGRSFNDLSQYPIFPWILADYESEKLDLQNPASFRDLSKPIGIQNEKHAAEVKSKYENFEDPSGVIAKFHYGTHYSNSAMVLHYLVRIEPFTSLHIELQSGRFDVADRQFHSIPQTWKSLYNNLNDVKELVPEFFYFPEFLRNMNKFDLGRLQGKKTKVGDVILPKWANSPEDFIRKHRLALESEHVSANLHQWIDLIFGYKQKGKAAVDALNVFYYCSYEGAVNLDAISDPAEREAVEGMINNFGQTPCQLLKEAHPKRMTIVEHTQAKLALKNGQGKVDMFLFPSRWKPFFIEMADEKDPVVFVSVPRNQFKSFIQFGTPDALVTISSSSVTLGVHGWLPYDKSTVGGAITGGGGTSNGFMFDKDLSAVVGSKARRQMTPPLTPGLSLNRKLFAVSTDAKFVFSGGHWDNSLQVFSISKARTVSKVVRHIDVITCLCLDRSGNFIMSGSRDTTSIVWEVTPAAMVSQPLATPNPRPVQVLSGHDKPVSCVSLSTELDMAVSGSEDGTLNVYTVKEGQYIRTISPPTYGSDRYTISQLALSSQGHVVFTGHSRDVHSLHTYTVNGHLLMSSAITHRITAIVIAPWDQVLTGDENGDLVLRDLLTPKTVHTLPLGLPITDVTIVPDGTHLLVPLRDGKLIIVGLKP